MKGYSTRDVSELLELSQELIREIARSGILEPARTAGNHYRFSFQDIIVLRTAKELLDAGVGRTKVNAALFRLKNRLPSNRPLTSLRVSGDGGAVVIRRRVAHPGTRGAKFMSNRPRPVPVTHRMSDVRLSALVRVPSAV